MTNTPIFSQTANLRDKRAYSTYKGKRNAVPGEFLYFQPYRISSIQNLNETSKKKRYIGGSQEWQTQEGRGGGSVIQRKESRVAGIKS